jgi:hypothetical protein
VATRVPLPPLRRSHVRAGGVVANDAPALTRANDDGRNAGKGCEQHMPLS